MQYAVIAIDGPSASGKSTVGRRVASRLGYLCADSGAVYRALTWLALRSGIEPQEGEALVRLAQAAVLVPQVEENAIRFTINGLDPAGDLRSQKVARAVSLVAAVPGVRRRVVHWLRGMREMGPLVMEGRDIGTAVFPETPFKFYLDAGADERARRRCAQKQGETGSLQKVREALERRDRLDSGRGTDPLRVAKDARVIDSTSLSVDEVSEIILREVAARAPGPRNARGGGA